MENQERWWIEIGRKKRVWYPGAIYHLMERGIRKRAIYLDDGDYQSFLAIMKNALEKNECILHAYCLMTNHFHLLVETKEMEIGKFMRHLASNYANYFNRKYLYKGHLFEGRYKGCLVEQERKENYFPIQHLDLFIENMYNKYIKHIQ